MWFLIKQIGEGGGSFGSKCSEGSVPVLPWKTFLIGLEGDCVWNVMAHAQKPVFVFRRNGWVHLNRRGRQFIRLLAGEVCASVLVMLDTPCSEVVWRVLATHSSRQFPLHFPSRASPCAISFQTHSTYWGNWIHGEARCRLFGHYILHRLWDLMVSLRSRECSCTLLWTVRTLCSGSCPTRGKPRQNSGQLKTWTESKTVTVD